MLDRSRPLGAPHGLAALITLCVLLAGLAQGQSLTPRAVAAPPEDILSGLLRLPDPSAAARTSRVAWWPVDSRARSFSIPAEGPELTLVGFWPGPQTPDIRVGEPGQATRPLQEWLDAGRASTSETRWPGRERPLTVWQLRTQATGSWSVDVIGAQRIGVDSVLLSATGGAPEISATLTSWDLLSGVAVKPGVRVAVSPGARLQDVSVHVYDSYGSSAQVANDRGETLDAVAADGVFTARLPFLRAGSNVAHIQARGVDSRGGAFVRSTWMIVPAARPAMLNPQTLSVGPLPDGRLAIDVPVFQPDPEERVQLSAEVWGAGGDGSMQPVAWISGIDQPRSWLGDGPRMRLVLHPGWIQRAAVTAPFELREVRLQDPDTHVPRARIERVDLPAEAWAASVTIPPVPPPITPAMTMGSPPVDGTGTRPLSAVGQVFDPTPPERALMLTHGYCSGPVWPLGDFSGTVLEFLDPNQSRSHDEFAQLLGAFGAQVDSFGLVAHSQGGPASLHLYTYYQSGLDLATGGRRIQSVGSPYQGSPLAGDIAALGSIFGAGCGPNTDLAPAGSLLWLAGIPSWARDEVHYWTTSTDGLWCLFLSQLLLGNPNDGVVERSRGQLSGAHNMGHLEGWCHTTAMNDPPQVTDTARNVEMDTEAAR